ncbi:hypothetical protein Esti_005293 [Eimeria stiedai]
MGIALLGKLRQKSCPPPLLLTLRPDAQPRVSRIHGKSSKSAGARAAFPVPKAIIAALVALAVLSSACRRLKGTKKGVGLVERSWASIRALLCDKSSSSSILSWSILGSSLSSSSISSGRRGSIGSSSRSHAEPLTSVGGSLESPSRAQCPSSLSSGRSSVSSTAYQDSSPIIVARTHDHPFQPSDSAGSSSGSYQTYSQVDPSIWHQDV